MVEKKKKRFIENKLRSTTFTVFVVVLLIVAAFLGLREPMKQKYLAKTGLAPNIEVPFAYNNSTPEPVSPSPSSICRIASLKENYSGQLFSKVEQVMSLETAVTEYLTSNPITQFEGYESFKTGGMQNMRFEEGWALFNVLGSPKEESINELGTSPIIILGVAHQNSKGGWDTISLETEPEYQAVLNCVPEDFMWLQERENVRP